MRKTPLMIALALPIMLACCTTTQKGGAIGGGAGAGAGAIIGHQSGHGIEGALIGGAIGALGGALVGSEMDKREQRSYRDSGAGSYGSRSQGDYYEGEYDSKGRKWAPEHEEIRVYTRPDGSKYEERTFVPGHYE